MNHHYNLTTEDPPYTDETAPPPLHATSDLVVWAPGFCYRGWLDASESGDMPEDCMHEMRSALTNLYYNESLFDYLVAVQGKVDTRLPGTMPHLEARDFTLKSSGVAYFGTYITENDVGELSCRSLHEMENELKNELWYGWIYGTIAALRGNLQEGVEVHPALFNMDEFTVTAGGNVVDITVYGNVPALWYQSKECGMPLDCLAAMERYFKGLKDGDDLYEYSVYMHL